MRLFAALPLPSHVADRLSALRLRLASPRDGLRWTSWEQWHITLHFFGELGANQADAARAAILAFGHPPVEVRLEELGRFPAKGILYAAVTPSTALTELQRAFSAHIGPAGFSSSGLPFHPHITLARSKGRAGYKSLEALGMPALPSLGAPMRWMGTSLHLYQSVLGPQGASYDLLAEVPLTAPPARLVAP